MITGEQLRMARAALKLTVKATAELAGVDKGTIVRIEAGEKSYRRTLKDLKEALEKEGVVFLDPVEGERGAGVALKWDFDPASVSSERADDHDSPEERSLSAIAWDEPSASQEILEQRAYWAAHPDRWAKLSEAGKAVLTRELGL